MILESIKNYIKHTLDESIESLSDDILENKNKQEVIKLVKDGLLGYALELWSSVDLENEIFGKDIVKYLFDINKEEFRYYDFAEERKLYYCLSDHELPKLKY